jgi:hypothetical protein
MMMTDMAIEKFDELASAYGAAIFLWPAEDQAAAEALAASSTEAQAVLERERALDAALDEWEAPEPSQALMARILGDAAEITAAAPVAEPTPHEAPAKPGFFSRFFGEMGWRPAGAMTACLAIGFIAGMSGAPAPLDPEVATAQEDNAVVATFFGDEDDSDPFDLEML